MSEYTTDFISHSILTGSHALIAGATGSGKSTVIENLLMAITSEDKTNYCYAIIDLKRISLTRWKNCPHCIAYSTTASQADILIKSFSATMEARYKKMEKAGVYKFSGTKLFLIIDEAADLLTDSPEILKNIVHLMRLARAANISIIYATQDASRTGPIKSAIQQNCQILVALRCRDKIASRQIISAPGAELLSKYGKALIYTPELMEPHLVEVPYHTDQEIINHISNLVSPD